jgi:hydroxymethylpyrimidine pyrophosphatase-like HAD family hydrolase
MAWYDEAVFYHIYPLGLTGAPKQNDYGEPVHRLNSLLPWIEYIRRIGCTALYIGPLFESVGHGYETTDYKKLDSRLGSNEDLKNFVAKCHAQGIRVILDGVFNHTGRDFFAFLEPDEYASKVLDSLDAVCGNVHNISFDANTHENAANLATKINELFPGQVTAFQNTQYVDIAPFGCSKGTGIDFVRNFLNIQCISGIGDSMNDLPMFKKTDFSFTFPDSPESLQAQADCIVSSVSEAISKL